MSDFFTAAQAVQGNNWLRNGNFLRLPRQIVARSYPDPLLTTPQMAISEVVSGPDASLQVGTAAVNDYVAAWSLQGSEDEVAVVDFDPPDKITGLRRRSFDSGKLLRVTFSKSGRVTIQQAVEVVNQFRGMPATLAFSVYAVFGSPRVSAQVDFGSVKKVSPFYYGEHVGAHARVAFEIDCPLDLSQIVVTIVVEGKRNQSIGVSGVAFALGPSSPFMPYVEAIGDVALPRGTIILWEGSACPPGFRQVSEAEDGFLFQTYGDPNLVSGGTEEYPNAPSNDPYYNAFASRRPEPRPTLGDNQHFVHQQTGLIGETAPDFPSGEPDGVKRMPVADFNDEGEPPGSGTIRKKSLAYTDASSGPQVDWPFDPNAVNQVEQFKRNTKQNKVLPGGAGDPGASNAEGDDVWRDPHRHTFKPKDEATLPPYRTFLFCEKI